MRYSFWKYAAIALLAIILSCRNTNVNPYETALQYLKEQNSLEEVCVDPGIIHPEYALFRNELEEALDTWLSGDLKLSTKSYINESKVDRYIRSLEKSINYEPAESRHIDLKPCVGQPISIFFSNIHSNIIYALVVPSHAVAFRNHKIVGHTSNADSYLMLFDQVGNLVEVIHRDVGANAPAQ